MVIITSTIAPWERPIVIRKKKKHSEKDSEKKKEKRTGEEISI